MNTPKQYQSIISELLSGQFEHVIMEWVTAKERNTYTPRVDVAVGPFASDNAQNIDKYDELMDNHKEKIEALLNFHRENEQRYHFDSDGKSFEIVKNLNRNARCLMAIEIENETSKKHLLGSAVNACALGRIGVIIGWTDKKIKDAIRLQRHLQILASVRKNTFQTGNRACQVFCVNPHDL